MRWLLLMMALGLSACAVPETEALKLYPNKHAAKTDVDFSEEVAARYPKPLPELILKAEFRADGFTCNDVPPVEGRGDYLMALCTLEKPHDECREIWTAEIRHALGDTGGAKPVGHFRRDCAATPN